MPYWTAGGEQTVEAARFEVWRRYVNMAPPRGRVDISDQWLAWVLTEGEEPTSDLSLAQQRRLDWWLQEGPLRLGPPRREGIERAHRELVERYRAWRATVPESSDESSRAGGST